jgi:hypothetical protein
VPKTGMCMKTWIDVQPALDESCCCRHGTPRLGNQLSVFALERHGQNIHVINCHNFSLVAAVCSREHQYVGWGAVRGQGERRQV